jgi:hypothetical protein
MHSKIDVSKKKSKQLIIWNGGSTSQNYSAVKLLVIIGVEWQNIFLCSYNQLISEKY